MHSRAPHLWSPPLLVASCRRRSADLEAHARYWACVGVHVRAPSNEECREDGWVIDAPVTEADGEKFSTLGIPDFVAMQVDRRIYIYCWWYFTLDLVHLVESNKHCTCSFTNCASDFGNLSFGCLNKSTLSNHKISMRVPLLSQDIWCIAGFPWLCIMIIQSLVSKIGDPPMDYRWLTCA